MARIMAPRWGPGPGKPFLTKQRRPGRIGRAPRRADEALVLPGKINRIKLRVAAAAAGIGAALAEIHQHPPVWRPGRPFDEIVLRQQSLAGTVRLHHADVKRPAIDLRERDQVAARRPYRRAVFPRTEADPPGIASVRVHDVK